MGDDAGRWPAAKTSGRRTTRYRFEERVVLLLLVLAPVVFLPRSGNAFEPPRAFLLGTAAALLLAWATARALERTTPRTRGQQGRGALRDEPSGLAARLSREPLGISIAAFLLSTAVSTAISMRPALSLFGVSGSPAGLVTALATAGVFFAARAAAGSSRFPMRLSVAASLAAAVATAYALVQAAGLDPLPWVWTATIGGAVRVPGTLGHPNHLGTYLAMTLPLMFFLIRRTGSRAGRAAWIAIAAAAVFVLGLTLSRGAWIAFAAGSAAYGGVSIVVARGARASCAEAGAVQGARAPFVRPMLIAAGVALALFLLPLLTPMGPMFLSRLRQIADLGAPTTQTRLLLWRAGLHMLADHPLFGTGTDTYVAAFPLYRTPEFLHLEWAFASDAAHNVPVQIAATQGALGLVTALLVVVFSARAVLRAARGPHPERSSFAAPAGAALAAFAVSGLTSFTVIATGVLATALAGWAAGAARSWKPAAPAGGARVGGATTLLPRAAGAVLGAVLWVPLVLTPWRAADAASRGLGLPLASAERARALERASEIAPWDEHYTAELGRTHLARAYALPTREQTWEFLLEARAQLERAIRIAPESVEDRAMLALAMSAQSSLRPDLVHVSDVALGLRRVLAADSTSADVLDMVVSAYIEIGSAQAAHDVAAREARLYPDYARPLADIGRILLAQGRYADAADTLRLATRRDWHGNESAEAKARANLAGALLRLGRTQEAREEAGRALGLSPSLPAAQRILDEAGRAP